MYHYHILICANCRLSHLDSLIIGAMERVSDERNTGVTEVQELAAYLRWQELVASKTAKMEGQASNPNKCDDIIEQEVMCLDDIAALLNPTPPSKKNSQKKSPRGVWR